MSKLFKIDMNIDISECTLESGFLKKPVDKEIDIKEYKERTAPEVFSFLCEAGIVGANPKVNYEQGLTLRKLIKELINAEKKGEFITNKTSISILINSIKVTATWPNKDEIFDVLEQIINKLNTAEEIKNEQGIN